MSLADQSQQWYPTSVQVTVLQARNLRIKGKNGTNDAYAIMQVAKEKFATSVVEKTVSPMWKEEATFDLQLFQHSNTERCTLHVNVMHRALVGPDKLLGQAVVNLLELSAIQSRSQTEWFKLLDKAGKPDKDRGEVLLDIQFLRNNMTASMFDLSAPDKPRSRLGKLKDKVRGKKKVGLSDSASAVVPSFTQVLTDSEGEGEPEGDGAADKGDKKKKHKLKSLFSPKSNLQRNVSQSMSVLGPLPERNSSLTGSRSSALNIDSSEGKRKFKFLTHKRTGSSDSKGSQGPTSILGHSRQSSTSSAHQSNLCINGSHVYTEEPQPRSSRAGSTFSLASSGLGSMEDLRRSQSSKSSVTSADSLKAGKQTFPWEEESIRGQEEQEEEEEEEGVELERESRVEQVLKRTLLDKEQRVMEEEKKRAREFEEEESLRGLEQERRRLEEEEQMKEERERGEERERIKREKEEKIRMEEQERTRVKEENRRIEEEERRRKEQDLRKAVEEAEKIRIEEEKRVAEEREKTFMEEEARRVRQECEEEEEKIREQKRLFEEERRKEQELLRKEEEERRVQQDRLREEMEKRKREEGQRIKREEEEEKLRKEEEELALRRAEEERERMDVEEKMRREEKRRLEEEQTLQEERRIREMEEKMKEEEEARLREEEEERKIREVEEKMKEEEEQRKTEEERRRKEKEVHVRKEEEARLTREEEERKIREVEEKRQEEDEQRRRREEEDRLQREEEHRLQVEEEERKMLDLEEEMRRKEEERRQMEEEERLRKEVEECRLKEEEERKIREMEAKRWEDEQRKTEERRRKEEEDRLKREEEHRLQVEEEERKIKELEEEREREKDEQRKTEEERRRKEKEDRLRVEEDERKIMEQQRVERQMEEKRKEERENIKLLEEEERRKLEEESRKEQDAKRREEEAKEANLEQERRREEEARERQEQEKMRLTVAEKRMVLQDREGETLVGKNPFEEVPSEDPFEDISSTNPFEETSTAHSTEPLNRSMKVSAVKPRPLESPNPFFSSSELEAPATPPISQQVVQTSPDSSASLTEKRRAPLPPGSLRTPPSSGAAAACQTHAEPTQPTLRSHSAAEMTWKTDARRSEDGVCLDRRSALQDKRPAPQPPDSLSGKPGPQRQIREDLRSSTEMMQGENNPPGEEKDSSCSRDSLCAVQIIAPLKAPTAATREESRELQGQGVPHHRNQCIDVGDIPSATGGYRAAKKGPAPSRPVSSCLSEKTEYDGNLATVREHSCMKAPVENDPSNGSPVVFEVNSVAGFGKETQSRKLSDNRESLQARNQTQTINEEVTLRKSSKVIRAPPPPVKTSAISTVTVETPQNSGAPVSGMTVNKQNSRAPVSGMAVNKPTNKNGMEQPVNVITQTQCFPASTKTPELLQATPGRSTRTQARSQPREAGSLESQGGEAGGGKGGQPASASRRPHPVKPLNSSEQQPASPIQGGQPEKSEAISGCIQEQIKVQVAEVTGPYSQLTQEELISLVVKQQKSLADRDKKIGELELYIDNLLVRVIEEAPCILMSLNAPKV